MLLLLISKPAGMLLMILIGARPSTILEIKLGNITFITHQLTTQESETVVILESLIELTKFKGSATGAVTHKHPVCIVGR
jgi:hypothetical protein